jgi:hypothetical protein
MFWAWDSSFLPIDRYGGFDKDDDADEEEDDLEDVSAVGTIQPAGGNSTGSSLRRFCCRKGLGPATPTPFADSEADEVSEFLDDPPSLLLLLFGTFALIPLATGKRLESELMRLLESCHLRMRQLERGGGWCSSV